MKTFITTLFLTLSLSGMAALIKTAQKGNWNDGSTWVGGNVPQTGDSIWIDHHDSVTVTNNVTLGNNTILVVDTMSALIINPGRRIDLGAGSRFYLRGPSSLVKSGSGGGSASLIRINGIDVWSAGVQGNIFGPICLPSGTVSWCGIVTLPVKYGHWQANVCGTSVCLDWSTVAEENNSHFTILRTTDLIEYEPIAILKGAGNSYTTQHYNYTDANVLPGVTYYYQLQQTDFNGNTYLTKLISTIHQELKSIHISPNPIHNDVHFLFTGFQIPSQVKIKLSDSRGKTLWEWEGQSVDFTMSLSEIIHNKGILYINCISTDIEFHQKLVVE